jgi:hypothetical protein
MHDLKALISRERERWQSKRERKLLSFRVLYCNMMLRVSVRQMEAKENDGS